MEEVIETKQPKKPSDSAFKQQRLPAWQPILTAINVLPTFFVIGIAFVPVGIGLLYFSDEVKEHVIDYTHCTNSQKKICLNEIRKNQTDLEPCICNIEFNLPTNFQGKVFMYYGLSNYYQNHRRYVKSRDDSQLLGSLSLTPSIDCAPFEKDVDEITKHEMPIAPCGAIANSMFNDVLTLYKYNQQGDGHAYKVPLLNTGIAWPSDKSKKFKNPEGDLQKVFENFTKPKSWRKYIWELDLPNPENNGYQNEDFIVWMRTAALPTFRKLYRRVDHSQDGYTNGLAKGKYELQVEYYYDVSAFDGSKRMILSTTSLLGGKNPFLGIAYIAVGSICILLGVILLIVHIKYGKSTSEMITVNPRTPYQ